jgi:glycerol kinase
MNTGSDCPSSSRGLLSTIAWELDGVVTYALDDLFPLDLGDERAGRPG